MRRKSIFSWFGFGIPMEERFRLIKNTGFDSTFLWWGDEYSEVDGPRLQIPETARMQGLYIENVHLPFSGANFLWTEDLESDDLMNVYRKGLMECAEQNIPTAVLHVTDGSNPPPITELGLVRIRKLVELAEQKSVNIALENLRKPEYLAYILEKIHSDRLGFCFDSGHQHCRTPDIDFLSLYGSRLMALHLHDNDGTEDQHLVPGEGAIDWNRLCRGLKSTGYNGAVALEVTNEFSQFRGKESAEEFLMRAYESADVITQNLSE